MRLVLVVSLLIMIPVIAFAAAGSGLPEDAISPTFDFPPLCSDFEDSTAQGWHWQAGSGGVYAPGFNSAYCLRSKDGSSPPPSQLLAPSRYYGDWSRWTTVSSAGDTCSGYVEFDIQILNDGFADSTYGVPVKFFIYKDLGSVPPGTLIARYTASDLIHEPGGPNDGWHHIRAPIHLIGAGEALPSDADGFWGMAQGSDSDWNDLLQNVDKLSFGLDLVGSSYQTEEILLDNFCVMSEGGCNTSEVCSTWPDALLDGWTSENATIYTDTPGYGGTGYYLRCGDESGSSRVIAPSKFHGDWTQYMAATTEGLCGAVLEYYMVIYNDGWSGETREVRPSIWIYADRNGTEISASYARYQKITEGTGWHQIRTPLYLIDSYNGELPPNDINGEWKVRSGTNADWNYLIQHVNRIDFSTDLVGSTYQTEDFGIDEFCIYGVPCSGGDVDLWVEDTSYAHPPTTILDTGLEPDPAMTGQKVHQARSIWNRQVFGTGSYLDYRDNQNFEFGQENYIYVRVLNRLAATAFDVEVEVYGTRSSGGLFWSTSFDLLGSGYISKIDPLGAAKAMVPWSPTFIGHVCLVAKVVHPQESTNEISNLSWTIRNNNGMSWRNTAIKDHLADVTDDVEVIVSNPEGGKADVSLVFEETDNLIADLGANGSITFDLAGLFTPWYDAGHSGSNIAIIPSSTLVVLTGTPARIDDIPMNGKMEETCRLITKAYEPVAYAGESREYYLDFVEEIAGEDVGGVSYHFLARALDTDSDGDGNPDITDPDDDNDGWTDAYEKLYGTNPLNDKSQPMAADIPALNTWGLLALALALIAAAMTVLSKKRRSQAAR